ncbi:MAG: carbonic anhydrase [Deltaproteobacteria bacterium]|nr:carbonic anhydrase [Deltaproteobacteria bacterium]
MKKLAYMTILILILVVAPPLWSVDDPGRILDSGKHAITKQVQQSLSPQEIIELFKKGNQRFVSGETIGHNYRQEMLETAADQFPPAIVLSCIDSRTAPEIVFDLGIGDIFDVRVAGNIVNEDIAGSMEYATKKAGSKVVLVMGHTDCGAVKGAVADLKLGNLTGLLAKLKPAVDALDKSAGKRSSKNKKFVDAAALENVKLTIENIRRISPVLRELEKEQKILITGCLYDIKTGQVTFIDEN